MKLGLIKRARQVAPLGLEGMFFQADSLNARLKLLADSSKEITCTRRSQKYTLHILCPVYDIDPREGLVHALSFEIPTLWLTLGRQNRPVVVGCGL